MIVDIDEASLAAHGQWPWPRTTLARLLERIGEGRPAAVALDIVMSEPDRLSPDRLAESVPGLGSDLARRLAQLPSHDVILGQTLRRLPSVAALVGFETADATTAPLMRMTPALARGGDPARFVRRFAAVLRSVDAIDGAAAGHGLVNPDPDESIVRRVPLVAVTGETLLPAMGVELFRVASGQHSFTVSVAPHGIEAVSVGDLRIPTQPDGTVWLHFSPHDPGRFLSAADVLGGRADPAQFEGKIVLVGVTAAGLGDHHSTPMGARMPGLEIHAQLIENIFDGYLLARPRWASALEASMLAVGSLLLVLFVPMLPARSALALAVTVVAAVIALGAVLYVKGRLLVDIAGPSLGLALIAGLLFGATLVETQRQRRVLRRQLRAQREAAARLEGELEAARRIQVGILPSPAVALGAEDRVALYALMEPAREVGGDLYDFFTLHDDQLFVLVGDVAGKGVPGSLFMAVSKALCKSAALRHGGDLAAMMREANTEISRDNAEALFVTAWVGVLDLATGVLQYCNAGHEPAWALEPAGKTQRLGEGGPPLCVIDDFPYGPSRYLLRPGGALCLVTDGVTEATNATGEFYGRARLETLLAGVEPGKSATDVGETIREDVKRFTAGAEAADDLTILVLTWRGGTPGVSGP